MTMKRFLLAVVTVALMLTVYFALIRRRLLTWGATKEETEESLPGDDIVQEPHFIATRAVTINAPPSEVWKWIIQIGSARAGWYSIDWLDNAGVPSSRKILPEFQKIETDDFIPFTPNQKNGMWVKDYKEFEHILWWDKKGMATWLWYLKAVGGDKTRLMTRLRTTYNFKFPWIIYYALYDFGDIVMMRKCMLGIKERAEANAPGRYSAV
ncbi:MAG TPA: hypothetical protein DEP84_24360 [Chloroflexi bacterium]|nr:hypothetical protein [Chloroflexota bacterium]